jgi:Restriction endonuclease NaeI
MTELVTLLRAVVDAKGCGLKELPDLLNATQGEDERPTPSYGTLSVRLRGMGMVNDGVLAQRIIIACAPPHDHEKLQERARELLAAARRRAATGETARRPSQQGAKARPTAPDRAASELRELRTEVSRLGGLIEELLKASMRTAVTSPEPVAAEQEPSDAGSRTPSNPERPTRPTQPISIDGANQVDAADPAVRRVADAVHSIDPTGNLLGLTFRQAIDEVLDGPHTGRYAWAQLTKLEKGYFGTKAEMMLGNALGLTKTEGVGYSIEGLEVETRVTVSGRWLFEQSAVGAIHLLVHVDDENSTWQLGVVRVTEDLLSHGVNRDGKRSLSSAGRTAITWVFRDSPLPENLLLHVPKERLEAILSHRSGQSRTDELFRKVTLRSINSTSVATVAMQLDSGKRARDARQTLTAEGIAVVGHLEGFIAERLGLTVPRRGEWMSVPLKVASRDTGSSPTVRLGDQDWVVAGPDDELEALPQDWNNTC